MTTYPVRVYYRGNHTIGIVLDQIRRAADRMGRPGIEAKGKQADSQFKNKGYVRLVFKTKFHALKFESVVQKWFKELGIFGLRKKRFKNRK